MTDSYEWFMYELRFELRRCILGAGLSQATLAGLLGMTPKHLNAMLTGRSAMSIAWALKIAETCGFKMSVTFSRTISSPPTEEWREAKAALTRKDHP